MDLDLEIYELSKETVRLVLLNLFGEENIKNAYVILLRAGPTHPPTLKPRRRISDLKVLRFLRSLKSSIFIKNLRDRKFFSTGPFSGTSSSPYSIFPGQMIRLISKIQIL